MRISFLVLPLILALVLAACKPIRRPTSAVYGQNVINYYLCAFDRWHIALKVTQWNILQWPARIVKSKCNLFTYSMLWVQLARCTLSRNLQRSFDSYAIKTGPQRYIDKRVCRQSVAESVGHFTSAYC